MRIIGHNNIWQTLKKSAETGRVTHAFLFFGPDKIGKKTLALEFVKLLNCQREKNNPCQNCLSCKEIDKRSHPDLVFIEPRKKEIQISQIRDLNWHLSLRSSVSPFKAAVIDEAHLMNEEAQNSLLKTLEEPRGNTIIILVTSFPELLLSTIISRTKRIRFTSVSEKEIRDYLKEQEVPEKEMKELISISLGKPGEIIEFLSNPDKLKERNKIIKDLEDLSTSPLTIRFQYAQKMAKDPKKINRILNIWLRHFRNELLLSLKDRDNRESVKKLRKMINLTQDIGFLLSKTEVNSRLALETLLLEL